MASKLEAFAKENGIKYFLVNFTDLSGIQRSKLVPTPAIAEMEENGAGFAGFATYLDMTPAHPDMFALPDPDSVIQLPWKPEVAWVASDLMMEGALVEQAPRVVLKRQLEAARAKGYSFKTGVEAEFHLITVEGDAISDPADVAAKPCYDQQAVMRRYDVISEICDAMIGLGWGPYQNDHEDANGQFEMNWDYDDALVTADRHAFFKFMVKSVAETHGLRATFMPKPFMDLTGNGCHMHLSLWDAAGKKCVFLEEGGELGLSAAAYHFLGGMMAHAPALAALTNPTVNSYKRINAPVTTSGATWSPNRISYGGNNRTHMVRIPDPGRFELRLADGAANPYLLAASVLAAGLDGMAKETDPGKRLDIDMYAEGHKARGVGKLPLYLIDAVRNFAKDKTLRAALGEDFSNAYLKIKSEEWNAYARSLTDWERKNTLDC
ncbi:type III glutamate--ammonia ligase [Marivibrio halodurans]|uniref:Type III glutamate--ammonia ligase n=1 Tax=Marivibrio halodurans TaxID=2039722 RepID=A0A8J7V441_9PROT|nr:type III glutamate--ammonia ligase [Marivibrio halodurans]MBP5859035.1 type III glutamate--ammonia ligase [Marivibrio halodurans]